MVEEPDITVTTQDRWSVPLKYVQEIGAEKEAFTVKEYKDINTHTNKHTHTHTHTHAHTQSHTHTQTQTWVVAI